MKEMWSRRTRSETVRHSVCPSGTPHPSVKETVVLVREEGTLVARASHLGVPWWMKEAIGSPGLEKQVLSAHRHSRL